MAEQYNSGNLIFPDFLLLANAHDVKNKEIWKYVRPYTATFFIFPPEPAAASLILENIREERIKLKMEHFVEFWRNLDDLHKERRFLVGFMCCFRRKSPSRIPTTKDVSDDDAIYIISGALWTMRELWIEHENEAGPTEFRTAASRFIKAFREGRDSTLQLAITELFSESLIKATRGERVA